MTVSQANTLMHCQTFCKSLLSMKIWNDYLKRFRYRSASHSVTIQGLSKAITYRQKHTKRQFFSAFTMEIFPQTLHLRCSPKLSWSVMTVLGDATTKPDSKIDLVKPIYTEMKCFELIFYWKTINYTECGHWTRLTLWKYACRKTNSLYTH